MEVVGDSNGEDERQLEHEQVRTTHAAFHQHHRRRRRRLFNTSHTVADSADNNCLCTDVLYLSDCFACIHPYQPCRNLRTVFQKENDSAGIPNSE